MGSYGTAAFPSLQLFNLEVVKSLPELRILFITRLPTQGKPQTSSFVYDYLLRLRKNATVFILAFYDYQTRPILDIPDTRVVRIPLFRIPLYSLFISPVVFFLGITLVRRFRVNIIHVEYLGLNSILGVFIGKICNIPVVATAHRGDVSPKSFEKTLFTFLSYPLVLLSLKLLNKIICVSQYISDEVKRIYSSANCAVIYNSADESRFYPRDKETCRKFLLKNFIKKTNNSKIILFVGSLIKRKGLNFLIEAMVTEPLSHLDDVLLLIVGEGPEKEKLVRRVEELSIQEKVFFIGPVTREELPIIYGSADLFVLPSLDEGHPVAMLEAMASGLPVIGCKVGGVPECIENGVNGILIRRPDPSSLAKAIYFCLSEQALFMGKKSRQLYESRFMSSRSLEAHLVLYKKLLRIQYGHQ